MRRSKCGNSHHEVHVNTLRSERFVNRKLVSRESTSLVRAEHIHTSERLNGSELLHNGLTLSEVCSTDSHCGGGNTGKTDRDTNNKEDQSVDEQVVFARASNSNVTEEASEPNDQNKHNHKNKQRCTDKSHDLLEVTTATALGHKGSSATDERLLSNVCRENVSLSALATSGVEDSVTNVLINSERFTSDGRLVTGNNSRTLVNASLIILATITLVLGFFHALTDSSSLGEVFVVVISKQTTIARNSHTVFNHNNVTGYNFTSFDLTFLTITDNLGLKSNTLLKLSDNVTSLLLLVPTDEGVKHKDTTDDTKIDPVTKTTGKTNSKLHDIQNRTTEKANKLKHKVLSRTFELIVTKHCTAVRDL